MTDIAKNTASVMARVSRAAAAAGKSERDIAVIAVSKTVCAKAIAEAAQAGIGLIGENYVQELCEKYDSLPKNKIAIHFVGHLQRNKVKYIIDKVKLIQSVDRLPLAQEIARQAVKAGLTMEVLVEVNIGEEDGKSGAAVKDVKPLIEEISLLPGIKVSGLMAIPPADKPALPYFRAMKQLYDEIARQKIAGVDMKHLSMGMSKDFEEAILCGANMVRVGTAIFGQRKYNSRGET